MPERSRSSSSSWSALSPAGLHPSSSSAAASIQYLVSGVIGAFVGGYLLDLLGIRLGIKNPLLAQIVTATIGAIVVVIIARLIS